MAAHSDNPADPFKKALAEATKVMANDPDLTVSYSVDPSGLSGDAMRLPQVSRRLTRDEVMLARGTADALALHRRYHNDATHSRYVPQGDMARDLYEAMETARCEAVGAREMPGTAGNIDARIGAEAVRRGYDRISDASEAPLATAAGYLIRHLATGRTLPPAADNVMQLWKGFIEDRADSTLEGLQDTLADQAEFARFARKIIADLGYGDQLGDDPDATEETLSAAVAAAGPVGFKILPYKSQPISAQNPLWEGKVLPQPYSPVNGDAGDSSTIELEWSVVEGPTKVETGTYAATATTTAAKK